MRTLIEKIEDDNIKANIQEKLKELKTVILINNSIDRDGLFGNSQDIRNLIDIIKNYDLNIEDYLIEHIDEFETNNYELEKVISSKYDHQKILDYLIGTFEESIIVKFKWDTKIIKVEKNEDYEDGIKGMLKYFLTIEENFSKAINGETIKKETKEEIQINNHPWNCIKNCDNIDEIFEMFENELIGTFDSQTTSKIKKVLDIKIAQRNAIRLEEVEEEIRQALEDWSNGIIED